MSKKSAIIGLAIVTTLALASAGQAAANTADGGVKSQRVSYADLDLSRGHDAQVLLWRIQRAANKVCSIDGDNGIDRLSRGYRSCVRMASIQAVTDLNSPVVTAAYEHKTGFEVATK